MKLYRLLRPTLLFSCFVLLLPWTGNPVFGQVWDLNNIEQLRIIGSSGVEKGNAIVLEQSPPAGPGPWSANRYVVGTFSGSNVLFGYTKSSSAVELTSVGGADGFVVKYDSSGAVLWAQDLGSTGNDRATAILRDGSGNVYVAGSFSGSVAIGSFTLSSHGMSDIFVVKFSSTGDILNAATAGGSGADVPTAIVASGTTVLVAGSFSSTCRFDRASPSTPLYLTSAGSTDIFLARVSGNYWDLAVSAGGSGADVATAMTGGGSSVYLTGSFSSPSASFGSTTLTSAGGKDIFVAMFDGSGSVSWATSAGGPGDDEGRAFGSFALPVSTMLVTGSFEGTAQFGSNALTSAGGSDIFVAHVRPSDGNWDQFSPARYGGTGNDIGCGLASNGYSPDGQGGEKWYVITGTFEGEATFGDDVVQSNGGKDIILIKDVYNYDYSVIRHELARIGGSGDEQIGGCVIDLNGRCYITGDFDQTTLINGEEANSSGSTDLFILRTSLRWVHSPATRLGFGTQPTSTPSGNSISPPVTVNVLDADGNLVTTENRAVTVAGFRNMAGSYQLYSPQTVYAVNGVATFPELSFISGQAGDYLLATTTNLGGAASNPLNITAAVPSSVIMVGTSPTGPSYTLDGATLTRAVLCTWAQGSNHTIGTTTPQASWTGTQYVFDGWTDGGALSHTITVPTNNLTYTANFATQYYLTMAAGAGGTVSPSSGWRNSGESVGIDATPNRNYAFTGWTGTGPGAYSGTTKSTTIPMNGPITQTAGFGPTTVPAGMVFIEGGTFSMGSSSGDPDEQPVHSVTVSGFTLDTKEVTVAEYRAFCTATGKSMPAPPSWGWNDTQPVVNVTWDDAVAYARWAGKRLPTEAEWEYAARGGKFAHGYSYSGSNTIGDVAWYVSNAGSNPMTGGGKTANELGLYDMSGNVWEWCYDWYDANYYGVSPLTNPGGPEFGVGTRVDRGGSFKNSSGACRVSDRTSFWHDSGLDDIGFRCAVDLVSSVDEGPEVVPAAYSLEQNYPNPFNPATTIRYTVGGNGAGEAGTRGWGLGARRTMLVVYDVLGRQVATLVDEAKAPGSYEARFDGSRLSSGVYIYRLTAGSYIESRKMILMK